MTPTPEAPKDLRAELASVLALLERATQGPWRFVPWHVEEGDAAVRALDGHLICCASSDDTAHSIAAAVNFLRTHGAALLHGGGGEAVATLLPSDPYDETGNEGPWMHMDDWKRLRELPAGTKLFTTPPPQPRGDMDIVDAYKTWPEDIRKKLSLHDLRRMNGWTPRGNPDDWGIDTSTGTPILVHANCSVIESEQARYVLGLIAKDFAAAPGEGSPFTRLPPELESLPLEKMMDDTPPPASQSSTNSPEIDSKLVDEDASQSAPSAGSGELLPCPFCGQSPVLNEWEDNDSSVQWVVCCNNNDCADVYFQRDTEAEVIAAWNRRLATAGQGVE